MLEIGRAVIARDCKKKFLAKELMHYSSPRVFIKAVTMA